MTSQLKELCISRELYSYDGDIDLSGSGLIKRCAKFREIL